MNDKLYGRSNLMIIAAVRYCLGRQSYIVGDCCDWIIANWQDWSERTRNLIQSDIEEEFKRDDESREEGREFHPLGMDMDRAEWERVRRLWK